MAALILALAVGLAGVAGEAWADEGEIPRPRQQAYVLWQQGTLLHLFGRYPEAIGRFQQSIDIHPTAEGHTYLGWSMSMLGQIDEAIAECKIAIALDPDYGNPYNDIGAYLIELGHPQEAIPWLEKAAESKRYCCYQFPHFNIWAGCSWTRAGWWTRNRPSSGRLPSTRNSRRRAAASRSSRNTG